MIERIGIRWRINVACLLWAWREHAVFIANMTPPRYLISNPNVIIEPKRQCTYNVTNVAACPMYNPRGTCKRCGIVGGLVE